MAKSQRLTLRPGEAAVILALRDVAANDCGGSVAVDVNTCAPPLFTFHVVIEGFSRFEQRGCGPTLHDAALTLAEYTDIPDEDTNNG